MREGGLTPGEFLTLLAGMLDVLAPDLTESQDDRMRRMVREAHEKAVAKAGQRGRRGRRR